MAGFDVGELPNACWSTRITLLMNSTPRNLVVCTGDHAGAMQAAGQRLVQHVVNQRTLAAAARTADDRQGPQRESRVNVAQIVVPGAEHLEPLSGRSLPAGARYAAAWAGRVAVARVACEPCPLAAGCVRTHAAIGGNRNGLGAAQVGAGDRGRACRELTRRSLGDDFSAMFAGGRAEIADVVTARNDLPIVLDHDQRVAQVAELVQGGQQPRVVARVQADGGFVQHVQHAAQPAP